MFKKVITLKSSSGIATVDFYKVETVKRPILITSLVNTSSSLVLSTLLILFLAIFLQVLKTAPNLSLIIYI